MNTVQTEKPFRDMLKSIFQTTATVITKTGSVVEVNLDSVEKLSKAGNHMASTIEREAKLELDVTMHRLEQQEAEFLKDLKAIEVQL